MKNLLTNERLIKLTEEIESRLGIISTGYMSDEHREVARCSMAYVNQEGWRLLIDPNSALTEATACHELAHLILVIEGWPFFTVCPSIQRGTTEYQTLRMLSNLALHPDVWEIVRQMGFNEIPDYKPGIDDLVSSIDARTLGQDVHPSLVASIRGAFIASALLGPLDEGYEKKIQLSACRNMPDALALANKVVEAFEKQKPLSPTKCADALLESFQILNLEPSLLTLQEVDAIDPNFRAMFI
ncbi:hypothetical protein FY046_12890 [Erwinia sp. 1181_3]|uniref:hypothetical protein n=1 Tax=Erwinia sp. 1181_3 TaxID=2605957 RepID=UPI0040590EA4